MKQPCRQQERQKPLSELAGQLKLFPQELINIEVTHKKPFADMPRIMQEVARIEAELAGRGRVLLRYSGTEQLARIMVEGECPQRTRAFAESLAEIVQNELK